MLRFLGPWLWEEDKGKKYRLGFAFGQCFVPVTFWRNRIYF